MKAYKITDRNLKSLTVADKDGGVQYGIGQATVPDAYCGPLAAFKNLEDVRLFKHLHGWRGAPVFECAAEKDKGAEKLWYYTSQGKKWCSLLPKGTILCKKIILRRLVE